MNLRAFVESGDRIGLFTPPFVIVGLILNVAFPFFFDVGGPDASGAEGGDGCACCTSTS